MGLKTKLVFAGMGGMVLLAGLSQFFPNVQPYVTATPYFIASILLFMSMAWKKLVDKKPEINDVVIAITGILGLVVFGVGLSIVSNFTLPSWLLSISTFATVVIGAFVIVLGLTLKK